LFFHVFVSAEPAQAPSWGNPPRAEIFDSGTISLYWRITFIGPGTQAQYVVMRIFSLPTGHESRAFHNAHFPLAFFVHTTCSVLPVRTGEGEPIPSDRGRSKPIPGPWFAIPGPWPIGPVLAGFTTVQLPQRDSLLMIGPIPVKPGSRSRFPAGLNW